MIECKHIPFASCAIAPSTSNQPLFSFEMSSNMAHGGKDSLVVYGYTRLNYNESLVSDVVDIIQKFYFILYCDGMYHFTCTYIITHFHKQIQT